MDDPPKPEAPTVFVSPNTAVPTPSPTAVGVHCWEKEEMEHQDGRSRDLFPFMW